MSRDLRTELRMHSLTTDCDTFSNEEKVAVVVPVAGIVVAFFQSNISYIYMYIYTKHKYKV